MEERDEGLIRFLMRESHGTPFEHNAFRFHVRCPIFVAREWFRHRVGCLAGESRVAFARPTEHVDEARVRGGSPTSTPPGPAQIATSSRTRRCACSTRAGGSFTTGRIADVVASGVRPVYDVALADGKQLAMTADHRVLTPGGWRTLREAVGSSATASAPSPRGRWTCSSTVSRRPSPPGAAASACSRTPSPSSASCTAATRRPSTSASRARGTTSSPTASSSTTPSTSSLGRYTELPEAFYVPAPEDVRGRRSGKPGAAHVPRNRPRRHRRALACGRITDAYSAAYGTYRALLDDGVAKEVARAVLPVGIYTEFWWTLERTLDHALPRAAKRGDRPARDPPLRRGRRGALLDPHGRYHAAFVARGRLAP